MTEDASPQTREYFEDIKTKSREAYEIAQEARKKNYDPEPFVEIKLAENLAERVIGLISSVAPQLEGSGAITRIQELEETHGALDWRVAMIIAHEIAQETFCDFEDEKEAMEVGIRTGFAYVTLGVVSAPLEGFTSLEIKKTRDNKDYFCLNYSGPVRAAGGTAASVSVLIADYVRNKMGYAAYDPTDKEIKRCPAELEDYHNYVTNLQYFPSKQESEFLMEHLPVEINGDPSEKYEVSSALLKDLDRVPTNRLRSGYCLIHSSCVPLKAPKMWKRLSDWGHDMDMGHWDFIEEFVELQTKMKSKGKKSGGDDEELTPNYTFIKDLVGGRPVLAHPMKNGGFRLRYGRSRLSGFSAQSMHPATMHLTNEFVAIGTQLKVERPGKAAAYSPCDTIDGPIVKLRSGEVRRIDTYEEAKEIDHLVEEIIYLGDILVNYGDFYDRNHKLIPAGFVEERWALEVKKHVAEHGETLQSFVEKHGLKESFTEAVEHPLYNTPCFEDAKNIAVNTEIPLHPEYTYYYNSISEDQLTELRNYLGTGKEIKGRKILRNDERKRLLELIGTPHKIMKETYVVIPNTAWEALRFTLKPKTDDSLHGDGKNHERLASLSGVDIRDKAGTFIGARMGRPEKAKMRELKGSPHVLFPVGKEGGRLRSFNSAMKEGRVTAAMQMFKGKDGHTTPLRVSERTGETTELITHQKERRGEEYEQIWDWSTININKLIDDLMEKHGVRVMPDLVKGVRGTTNSDHVAEHLLKGILRAKHGISVNKDGTIRYDCSELTLTHFKPKEIGASIERLKELGYQEDIHGNPLESTDQVVELKVQDIVIPCCDEALDEPADEVMVRTCRFVDDILVKMYGLEPYYNVETREDLIGKLAIGLAPHTSAGILTRIIGFSDTQAFLAHPYVHAAMRRDCDGDESCFVLLMDGFLNFSNKYLPSSRGSTMDAPLVLTSIIQPTEVDDMIFNMDCVYEYPLRLYEAADEFKTPYEVDVEIIEHRIGKPEQYENIGFTHDTDDFNESVRVSAYKTLPSMPEKVESQMDLAVKIRAVDESDVAKLTINKHFIRDTKGNLRKFSLQTFRCVACNEKYRRPPLSGKCRECDGKVIFTINEGGITKYMDLSLELANKYDIEPYSKQVLELTQDRIEGVFGKEKEIQTGLDAFI